jgi:hypothetical protein
MSREAKVQLLVAQYGVNREVSGVRRADASGSTMQATQHVLLNTRDFTACMG